MKNLIIGDRIFDPDEIEHCELHNNSLYVYYYKSDYVSKIKFSSFEEAALEFGFLPRSIRKVFKGR